MWGRAYLQTRVGRSEKTVYVQMDEIHNTRTEGSSQVDDECDTYIRMESSKVFSGLLLLSRAQANTL